MHIDGIEYVTVNQAVSILNVKKSALQRVMYKKWDSQLLKLDPGGKRVGFILIPRSLLATYTKRVSNIPLQLDSSISNTIGSISTSPIPSINNTTKVSNITPHSSISTANEASGKSDASSINNTASDSNMGEAPARLLFAKKMSGKPHDPIVPQQRSRKEENWSQEVGPEDESQERKW